MPGPSDVLNTARKLHLDAELHPEVGEASTAKEAAQALGVEEGQIGKSILVIVQEDEPVLVIVAGPDKVDFAKVAKQVSAAANEVRLAEADEVLEHTGFEVGEVPPVGLLRPIRTLLDRNLTQSADRIFVGAGAKDAMLEVASGDLRKLPDVTLGDFAQRG